MKKLGISFSHIEWADVRNRIVAKLQNIGSYILLTTDLEERGALLTFLGELFSNFSSDLSSEAPTYSETDHRYLTQASLIEKRRNCMARLNLRQKCANSLNSDYF